MSTAMAPAAPSGRICEKTTTNKHQNSYPFEFFVLYYKTLLEMFRETGPYSFSVLFEGQEFSKGLCACGVTFQGGSTLKSEHLCYII